MGGAWTAGGDGGDGGDDGIGGEIVAVGVESWIVPPADEDAPVVEPVDDPSPGELLPPSRHPTTRGCVRVRFACATWARVASG
jgi:hypothetical protein